MGLYLLRFNKQIYKIIENVHIESYLCVYTSQTVTTCYNYIAWALYYIVGRLRVDHEQILCISLYLPGNCDDYLFQL